MADTQAFLENAPLAQRIRVPARIVLKRDTLSMDALAATDRAGSFRIKRSGSRLVGLEAAGQTFARGELVKEKGAWYFKVLETEEEAI